MESDRRRHRRQTGEGRYLRVAGQEARLIDWSFSGIGIRLEEPADLTVGAEVTVAIREEESASWVELAGCIRRIDDGVIGIEFLPGETNATPLLLKLLSLKLRESRDP